MPLVVRILSFSTVGVIVGVFCWLGQLTANVQEEFRIPIDTAPYHFGQQQPIVNVQTSIRWVNVTATHHTVTHDGCVNGGMCVFDSNPIPPDGQFEVLALPPGEYSYHCRLHPVMRGKLIVSE